ncbi:MAG: SAM-dependent chlorinase/fluorinase [Chitinophagaceae bacterium]|nr:SAM-dependent chlorinase/fluorinase [Chitinophagaceae bacterium]
MFPITLTSDFGLQNHYVASVKGKILFQIPDATIIDISHQIVPYNLQQAAYLFKSAYLHFPPGTIHFVLNDLHANANRQLLYVYENGQHIFCADNGFITLLFDDRPAQIFLLKDIIDQYNYLEVVEHFTLNATQILQGLKPNAENIAVNQIMIKRPAFAYESNNTLEVQVLHIDSYGNVILNVSKSFFYETARGRSFRILFMRDEELTQISQHYNDVPVNEKLCLFNTAGYLEIAIHKGHAASLFGFKDVDDRSLFYSNVKIFFE